ncbi:hypothetical protein T484DRAFT_1745424 [Baffinella frigidus]|nr:hypothetical protein T484DRAFT_1745424 [Cryptophyta sp. CCMP2293]
MVALNLPVLPRDLPGTTFDELAASQQQKARRFPSRAPTSPPTLRKELYSTQQNDNEYTVLFIKHPTAPVWSPSPLEEVKVMQNTSRQSWNILKRRFQDAHVASSVIADIERLSRHNTKALAVKSDQRKSVAYAHHSGDSPQRERQRRLSRPGSVPDQRQRTLWSQSQPLRRSPTKASVRGSPLGSTGAGWLDSLFSRQPRLSV